MEEWADGSQINHGGDDTAEPGGEPHLRYELVERQPSERRRRPSSCIEKLGLATEEGGKPGSWPRSTPPTWTATPPATPTPRSPRSSEPWACSTADGKGVSNLRHGRGLEVLYLEAVRSLSAVA